MRAFNYYQHNILPNGRGWLEESQKYLDAMVTIENEIKRMERENIKKQTKKK